MRMPRLVGTGNQLTIAADDCRRRVDGFGRDESRQKPMSLMPSRTVMKRTPGVADTSRSKPRERVGAGVVVQKSGCR